MIRLWQFVRGVVAGWVRQVQANDSNPALDVVQDGAGIGLRVKGHIKPSADNTHDLGDQSTPLRYRVVYAKAVKAYGPELLTTSSQWYAMADGPGSVGFFVRANANQTADLFQVQDSAGVALAGFEDDGDLKAPGGFKQGYSFMQTNVAAGQAAVAIDVLGLAGNTEIVMPFAGSVIGISVASNAARTAGTLTVDATINGVATGLQALLDATNPQYHRATQAKDTDTFAAGARLGVKITTSSDWAPTTADIVVCVIVEM